jgi:hypothetical protein
VLGNEFLFLFSLQSEMPIDANCASNHDAALTCEQFCTVLTSAPEVRFAKNAPQNEVLCARGVTAFLVGRTVGLWGLHVEI